MRRTSRETWLLKNLFFFWLFLPAQSSSSGSDTVLRKLVIGVDGGTESIRACCFDATTGKPVGDSCAVPYTTYHPEPGWAEQNPEDWYENLGQAGRGAVQSIPSGCQHEISAMSVDSTCCSVVALDKDYHPLRPCLLWMDQRSAPQTKQILERCKGDPALNVNCGGEGPLSAEWMTPKSLWINQNEPQVWEAAETVCEYQDYINYKLTGVLCASSCNAASRWHWDGEKCLSNSDVHPGRPLSMYNKLGIPELADKLPKKCLPMGATIGQLTPDAARHLGLPEQIPVVQGGPDAFVGMIGLGCIHPGQLCLITGSSHLHCVVSSKPTTSVGTWGAYRGAPLPGINFAEGGQSSTGSIIRWARNLFGNDISYQALDNEADSIAPGADGLIALETFQGSRTPTTDPLARGALFGLTLSHTRAHVWRALMEAVCFGTRSCIEGLAAAGHGCDEIILAGGITRSPLWLQMHADVTGKPVKCCENADAPLLGCAILASVGVGIHDSVQDAVQAMVRTAKRVEPNPDAAEAYDDIYKEVYRHVAEAARPISHAIDRIRKKGESRSIEGTEMLVVRGGDLSSLPELAKPVAPEEIVVSPSLLASDWSDIRGEVHRCMSAGATRFHVDVFDGVFLDSPNALTFGPQMVKAIRDSCDSYREGAMLDLHVCVDRPARYILPMASAGGDRFIFQWEATYSPEEAAELSHHIVCSGMECGISINPSTSVSHLFPLLETGLVSAVDILSVEPGFGGQIFQRVVLEKIQQLKEWKDKSKSDIDIMVDGGINNETARDSVRAGANVLVAGTFLFGHPDGMAKGIEVLRQIESRQ